MKRNKWRRNKWKNDYEMMLGLVVSILRANGGTVKIPVEFVEVNPQHSKVNIGLSQKDNALIVHLEE